MEDEPLEGEARIDLARGEDLDAALDALVFATAITEERHEEILEGIDECRNQLESLSNQVTQAESPLLAQILAEVSKMGTELANLKAYLDSTLSRLKPSESEESQEESQESRVMEVVEPKTAESTEEPKQDEQPVGVEKAARRRRVL